jgi:signal peptidase I
VLLALLGSGLGYVYTGRPLRAVVVGIAVEALGLAAAAFLAMGPVGAGALGLLLAGFLVFMLAVCRDVARCARTGRPRFLRRGAVLLACFVYLLLASSLGLGMQMFRNAYVAEPFFIASQSMWPTGVVGDHMFVDRVAGRTREPQRGEVVVFTLAREGKKLYTPDARPDLPMEWYVKRVVGLPGDVIELRDAALYINGERQTDDDPVRDYSLGAGSNAAVLPEVLGDYRYQVLDHPKRSARFGPTMVEPGRYYLVGDHRDNSNDSRFFGTVRRADIRGPVGDVYWSWSYVDSGAALLRPSVLYHALKQQTRWSRLGHSMHGER